MPRIALTVKQRRALRAERMTPIRELLAQVRTKAELARHLHVSRSLVTHWFNHDAVPSATASSLASVLMELNRSRQN